MYDTRNHFLEKEFLVLSMNEKEKSAHVRCSSYLLEMVMKYGKGTRKDGHATSTQKR